MAVTPLHLVDKSAYEQRRHAQQARDVLDGLAETGGLATCEVVALEILYSARNAADYERLRDGLESLRWLEVTNAVLRRALDVQRELAGRGHHRVPLPDLMIAATAEEHGAVVLHYDKDYEVIAHVTDQPTRWIVPRGTGG